MSTKISTPGMPSRYSSCVGGGTQPGPDSTGASYSHEKTISRRYLYGREYFCKGASFKGTKTFGVWDDVKYLSFGVT